MSKDEINRLIHDFNAELSALSQAVNLVNDKFEFDKILARRMSSLMPAKMDEILLNWEKIKELLSRDLN